MAITIQQQPTSPGQVNSNLIWTVSSNQFAQPQFQYVVDIYLSGSATRLQRVKQQPNPNSYGVFDFGQILSQYMSTPSDVITTSVYTPLGSTTENRQFVVKFGEEYGTSPSSSVTLYNGNSATPGNPAKTSSAYYEFANGLVEPNNAVNWNWNSGSYLDYYNVNVDDEYDYDTWLTNASRTLKMRPAGDYHTLSIYNGNYNVSKTQAQDIYWVDIRFYNSASVQIGTPIAIPNITGSGFVGVVGPGPRTSVTQSWSDVLTANPNAQNSYNRLIHLGVGAQNIIDEFVNPNETLDDAYPNWTYYQVRTYGQNAAADDVNKVSAYYTFERDTANCGYPGVRFAWKNEFGVWDYYTFKLQSDSNVGIERTSYKQTFVNFSADTSVTYDKTRRGSSQFYNELTQTKTANTDWLTQAEADWLRELFFSTDVYYQDGTDVLPCIITSANVIEKTNPRTQKNFQYQIEFQPANQLRPRL